MRRFRSNYHTQWAGAFAIAAELSRREYTVAFTLGNAKVLEMIYVPSGCPFKVEAKGTARPTFIRTGIGIFEMPLQADLFLVIALLPSEESPTFRFFLLNHGEVREARLGYSQKKASGDPYVPGHEGLTWATVQGHEDRWDKLPL